MERLERLKQQTIDVIRKHGMPHLVRGWLKRAKHKKIKNMADLQALVHDYHHHSYLMGVPRIKILHSSKQPAWDKRLGDTPMPSFTMTHDGIGRVTFYHFFGIDNKAESRMKELVGAFLNKPELKGLILDLRYHTGGNVWPLIRSLKHVLRGATLKANSQEPLGRRANVWERMGTRGGISVGKHTGTAELPHFSAPIAVLIGPNTSSSGEIAAAVFHGRPNSRSFGKPTSGDLSSNGDLWVSEPDGLGIQITSSLITSADGTFHVGERLVPLVDTTRPVGEAQQWIRGKTSFE
jgi:hypothetical protein